MKPKFRTLEEKYRSPPSVLDGPARLNNPLSVKPVNSLIPSSVKEPWQLGITYLKFG